jgi:hypothetical protein
MLEQNEREYRYWCRAMGKDPEDVGSAVEYEEEYEYAAAEAARDRYNG